MTKPTVLHFDYRQVMFIEPTQEDVNEELIRYEGHDVDEVL